jgi:26S proteasome regulatory subunit N8
MAPTKPTPPAAPAAASTANAAPVAVAQSSLVTVHPLVLLSVVDHYNRVAKNTKKRALGVLLGQAHGNKVNVANSFAGMRDE